jgi:hypothetical protein
MSHWTVRVRVTSEDVDTGKLRSKMETFLVNAESIEQAQSLIRDHFRTMIVDHEIRGISKSGIVDYIDGFAIVNKGKEAEDFSDLI